MTPSDRVKAATVAVTKLKALPSETVRHPYEIVGSGFCIDPCGIIVTSRHVVDEFLAKPALEEASQQGPTGILHPKEAMHVAFFENPQGENTRLLVHGSRVPHVVCKTSYDLALLRIPLRVDVFPSGFPAVEIAEPEEIHEGDEVGVWGFPLGVRLRDTLGTVTSSLTRGVVSAVMPHAGVPRDGIRGFQLDARVAGGNSGGPAFLWTSGRVFGVVESKLEHLTKATPLHHLLDPEVLSRLRDAFPGR